MASIPGGTRAPPPSLGLTSCSDRPAPETPSGQTRQTCQIVLSDSRHECLVCFAGWAADCCHAMRAQVGRPCLRSLEEREVQLHRHLSGVHRLGGASESFLASACQPGSSEPTQVQSVLFEVSLHQRLRQFEQEAAQESTPTGVCTRKRIRRNANHNRHSSRFAAGNTRG